MKAAVTEKAGPASVIKVKDVPVPEVKEGWVLIRIGAFGLNRSVLFTRQGDSPGVRFPRIQGRLRERPGVQGGGEDSGQGGETRNRHRPIGIW